MKHDAVYMRLRELSWRRKLTAAQEAELHAYLTSHPEAQTDWETEAALGEVLARLVDTPIPSNFTARVLQAVELEAADHKRVQRWSWSWQVLLPRAAVVVAVAGLGLFAYQRYEVVERAKLARSVTAVWDAKSLPSPQVLADFDAIRRLSKTPPPDEELLALLK
jgi:anti-sigma factor RsiW